MVTGSYPNYKEVDRKYFFRNVNIICTNYGEIHSAMGIGFSNCANLTNCTGSGSIGNRAAMAAAGFYNCTNLTDCTGSAGNFFNCGVGFYKCTNLINCIGTGTGGGTDGSSGIGFYSCTNLTNCIGNGIGSVGGAYNNGGYGFVGCTNLTNCTGTGTTVGNSTANTANGIGFSRCTNLTNCTGTGTAAGIGTILGHGFSSCRAGFGCKKGNVSSTTATFASCYMEQSTGTTAWANTAAGGYNLA